MAIHKIFEPNEITFYKKLVDCDEDIIKKCVSAILNAIKRKKKSVNIFDITFKNKDSMLFSIDSEHYSEFLSTHLNVFVEKEDYETATQIRDAIQKLSL